MNTDVLFAVVTLCNVIFSTIKTIITINGNALAAALSSAGYYAFYSYVIILTADDSIDLIFKMVVTGLANLIGVFIVKYIEKKTRPTKLWKIEVTCYTENFDNIERELNEIGAEHNYTFFGKHVKFECFTSSKEKSKGIAKIVSKYDGRYFVTESKGALM